MSKGRCSVSGCESPHYGRGFCNRHWRRWRLYGDPLGSKPRGPKPKPKVLAESRACTICGVTKTRDHFMRRPSNVDGLYSWCKTCVSEKGRTRYATDPEFRQNAIDRALAHAAAKPEESRARWRAHYEANAEKKRAATRDWRVANPDRARANEALSAARRRVLKAEAIDEADPVDLAALWDGYCGICHEVLSRDLKHPDPLSPSVDHIIPLAKGGVHAQRNLQWAHLFCNLSKGDRLVDLN